MSDEPKVIAETEEFRLLSDGRMKLNCSGRAAFGEPSGREVAALLADAGARLSERIDVADGVCNGNHMALADRVEALEDGLRLTKSRTFAANRRLDALEELASKASDPMPPTGLEPPGCPVPGARVCPGDASEATSCLDTEAEYFRRGFAAGYDNAIRELAREMVERLRVMDCYRQTARGKVANWIEREYVKQNDA